MFARLRQYLCHKRPWSSRDFRSFPPSDSHRSDFSSFIGLFRISLNNSGTFLWFYKIFNITIFYLILGSFERPKTDNITSSVWRKELDVFLHSFGEYTAAFNSIRLYVILKRTDVFSWRITVELWLIKIEL